MSIRRIARMTGLSPSAVSLALRNSPKISTSSRRRVQRIAERLGYHPNVRVTELMSQVRLSGGSCNDTCLAVISLYDSERPWETSIHLGRVYEGMKQRATALGYRLDPLWLRAPKMTPRRFRGILDARGIQGLLCLGSRNYEEEFPGEFDHYAIVTQGMSIRTSLHRVVTHAYRDMWRMLDRLHASGYRRPGLVISNYEEVRSDRAYISAYLGWYYERLEVLTEVPVLRMVDMDEQLMVHWLRRQRPDVIVLVHGYDALAKFAQIARRHGIRIPEHLGVAAMSQKLEGSGFSGLQENQRLIGAWAVEMVIARIMNLDFGIPTAPRIELVDSLWIEGKSLRSDV